MVLTHTPLRRGFFLTSVNSSQKRILWVKLPDGVDALQLYPLAQAAGIAINPGPEWSVNKAHAKSHLRLCFASLSHEEINQGVAALAEVCRKEFGVPASRPPG